MKIKSHVLNYRSKLRAAAAGVAATALVAGNAHAGTLADAFLEGVDKVELTLIGAAVLGVVGIIFLISQARRTGR